MGARAVAPAAAVAVVALAPALVWFASPASPLLALLVGALAIGAALHGLGRAVGGVIGDAPAPWPLAIAWGLAGYLALGGWLAAAGVFDQRVQRGVLIAATAIGAVWMCRHAGDLGRLPRPRLRLATLAPIVALAAVVLNLVGAAGAWQGAFSDGEAHLLGPLRRLADTGALGDPFALPRTTGLGGNAVLHTLTAAFGDWRMAHAIDRGLGLGLVVALAFAGTQRGAGRMLTLFAIVGLVSGVPEFPADLAPRWIVVALIFALHQTLTRRISCAPGAAVPSLLLAAALATLRHGGIGALAVIAIVAVRDTERPRRGRALALVALITAVVLGGYLVSARLAAGGEPHRPSIIASLARGAPLRLALGGSVAAVAWALAGLAVRGHGDRALELTIAATCAAAALAGPLAPAPAVWLTVQPLGIALVLLIIGPALAAAALRVTAPPAVAVVVGLALAFATLRFPLGRPPLSWQDRLGRLLDAARALNQVRPDPDDADRIAYADVLRSLPATARIGLYVDRPELIDYRGRSILDLRSAAATACTDAVPRTTRWFRRSLASCRQLDALLPRLHLDYLIVAAPAVPRPDAWGQRPWCYLLTPHDCIDPISRFVGLARRRVAPALDVVDLR